MIEVKAFPENGYVSDDPAAAFNKFHAAFRNLLTEFHKFSKPDQSSLEMLWLGEKVENQFFASRLRLFFIFRIIGKQKEQLEKELILNRDNILSALNMIKMEAAACEDAEPLRQLLRDVDCSHHYSLVKAENVYVDQLSGVSFYSWSILNNVSTDSLVLLLKSLSQLSRFAVSFQLIPTTISQTDQFYLANVKGNLQNLLARQINDMHLSDALSAMRYVENHFGKPFFYYGISVFGPEICCRTAGVKLSSLLNSGTERIADNTVTALDLSREQIRLQKHFFIYPWLINNLLLNKYRNQQLLQVPVIRALAKFPYCMSTDELLVFFRAPLYDVAMPFLKKSRASGEAEQFSEAVLGDDTIKIGTLLDSEYPDYRIGIPYKAWTKHAVIVGAPGSGKTTFSINILMQFHKADIPFLAIEPTKNEYRAMIDVIPDLQIFTPGLSDVSPFIVNPFIPPVDVTVEQYTPNLMGAFKAAFSMDGPLSMLFLKTVNECYEEYGWQKNSKLNDPGTTVFGMYEFILKFKKVMQSVKYKGDVHSNIETAGLLRLMNLIEQNPMMYDTVHTVPVEDLLRHPTVLELNAVENEDQKTLIMSLILCSVLCYTKNIQKGNGSLKNILLIDEAHVLLDAGADRVDAAEAKIITVRTIQRMIAEVRSYGTGIILADQSPAALSKKAVALSDIKVVFQLNSQDDCNMIAANTRLSESDAAVIPTLDTGVAFVTFKGFELPHLVKTEDARAIEHIRLSVENDEIRRRSTYWEDKRDQLIPFRECGYSSLCGTCSIQCRSNAMYFSSRCYHQIEEKLTEQNALLYLNNVPKWLAKSPQAKRFTDFKRLVNCTMIHLARKIALNKEFGIPMQGLQKAVQNAEKED